MLYVRKHITLNNTDKDSGKEKELLFIIPTLARLRKAYAVAGTWGFRFRKEAMA